MQYIGSTAYNYVCWCCYLPSVGCQSGIPNLISRSERDRQTNTTEHDMLIVTFINFISRSLINMKFIIIITIIIIIIITIIFIINIIVINTIIINNNTHIAAIVPLPLTTHPQSWAELLAFGPK